MNGMWLKIEIGQERVFVDNLQALEYFKSKMIKLDSYLKWKQNKTTTKAYTFPIV